MYYAPYPITRKKKNALDDSINVKYEPEKMKRYRNNPARARDRD